MGEWALEQPMADVKLHIQVTCILNRTELSALGLEAVL